MSTSTNGEPSVCISHIRCEENQMMDKSTQTSFRTKKKPGRPKKRLSTDDQVVGKTTDYGEIKKLPTTNRLNEACHEQPRKKKKRNTAATQMLTTNQVHSFEPCARCANIMYNSYWSAPYHRGMALLLEFCQECSLKAEMFSHSKHDA